MTSVVLDVRPEIALFACLMEQRLRENDHKPGWKNDSAIDLYNRVGDEKGELLRALARFMRGTGTKDDVVKEAADAANFLMMVADVVGGLTTWP